MYAPGLHDRLQKLYRLVIIAHVHERLDSLREIVMFETDIYDVKRSAPSVFRSHMENVSHHAHLLTVLGILHIHLMPHVVWVQKEAVVQSQCYRIHIDNGHVPAGLNSRGLINPFLSYNVLLWIPAMFSGFDVRFVVVGYSLGTHQVAPVQLPN